uniref:apolipoprotein N-acyltransferase n=1 Tax=Aquabacter sp. L1I39 TaxID=2820278 RepID=UPI001FFC5392|nr:apolipoprotein N-acyltransferase [Aquabacter sp. L1I39]
MTRIRDWLGTWADLLRSVTGWRRWGCAFLVGTVSAASTAPFDLWPVLALTFPALVLLMDGIAQRGWRGARAAGAVGWWFGFGYFLASLWWIGNAFLVDADVFAWLLPFAVVSMPAGLALFSALGLAVARLFWGEGARRIAALCVGLGGAEWLRGHVLTGFPWNTFGYAVTEMLPLAQGAALVGLWGLTFLTILIFATPVLLIDRPVRRGGMVVVAGALVLLVSGWVWGNWRLATTEVGSVPGVRLRVVQPAIPQNEKFVYARRHAVLDEYLDLSSQPSARYPGGLADVTLLIWPESAFPFIYEYEPWARERIAATLPENVTLVTGAARRGPPPAGQTSSFFNSIRVMDHDGRVLQSADKVHLVPFGEYLPFQSFLESLGLEQLTRVRGGFSSGSQLEALRIPGAPAAGPLICYEAIFPGAVLPVGERPGFLLNVTNDAWFGMTPGPYQHFLQARLRSIEEGLPMVRAANTGISAIIDPLGRNVATLGLGERGVLDAILPQRLPHPPLSSRHGALPALFIYLMSLGVCLRHTILSLHPRKHVEVDRR